MARTRLFLSLLCFGLAACTPALNWREVTLEGGELKALLPCKPDTATRAQQLGDEAVMLSMAGCEADGALFAVAGIDVGSPARMEVVQQQWQRQMLENLQGRVSERTVWTLRGATGNLPVQRLQIEGIRADGRAVQAQAIWFSSGRRLYLAALYADRITQEMAEPFFSGLEPR